MLCSSTIKHLMFKRTLRDGTMSSSFQIEPFSDCCIQYLRVMENLHSIKAKDFAPIIAEITPVYSELSVHVRPLSHSFTLDAQ